MDALLRILPKPLVAAICRRAILRPGAVAFERGGFALAQQALPSGDVVPFYERPARTEDGEPCAPSKTLIMLHGFRVTPHNMAPLAVPVSAAMPKSVRCLVPTFLGHGDRIPFALDRQMSGIEPGRSAMVSDLDAFLRALDIDGPVDLVEYSQGGCDAFDFSGRHAERVDRLALLAPALVYTAAYMSSYTHWCNEEAPKQLFLEAAVPLVSSFLAPP